MWFFACNTCLSQQKRIIRPLKSIMLVLDWLSTLIQFTLKTQTNQSVNLRRLNTFKIHLYTLLGTNISYPLPKHFWRYVSCLEGLRVLDLQQIHVEKVTPDLQRKIRASRTAKVRALPGVVSMVGNTVDGQKSCEKTTWVLKPVANNGICIISTGWPDFFHQQYHPSSSCKKENKKKRHEVEICWYGICMKIALFVVVSLVSLSVGFFPCLLASCLQSKSQNLYILRHLNNNFDRITSNMRNKKINLDCRNNIPCREIRYPTHYNRKIITTVLLQATDIFGRSRINLATQLPTEIHGWTLPFGFWYGGFLK